VAESAVVGTPEEGAGDVADWKSWKRKEPQEKTDKSGLLHSQAWPSQQDAQPVSSAPPRTPCTAPSGLGSFPRWAEPTIAWTVSPSSCDSAPPRAAFPPPIGR